MSRFWEIVFCVPVLFRHHVCLSNLRHEPSRELSLTACKTVFNHLKGGIHLWLVGWERLMVSQHISNWWYQEYLERAFIVQSGAHNQERATSIRSCPFSRTSLFLEQFWREYRISLKFHKQVSKTYRPKNDIFCLLITFSFPFWYLILQNGGDSIFAGKSALKCV